MLSLFLISLFFQEPEQTMDVRIVPEERIVTSYCLQGIMANGEQVHNGAAACPRAWNLGEVFWVEEDRYVCEDRLSLQYDQRIDIWKESCDDAIRFGKQQLTIWRII